MIRQGACLLVEIAEYRQIAGEARDGRHAVTISEDAELLGRRKRRGKAQPRRVTQWHLGAFDHAEAAERAAALGDDAAVGYVQGLAEALVGRGRRLEPCRRPRKRRRHRQRHKAERCASPSLTGHGKRGRRERESRDQAQAIFERQHEHGQHDAERACAGAHQIGPIDAGNAGRQGRKRQANGAGSGKERQRQREIHRRQIKLLAPIPDHLERVERQA